MFAIILYLFSFLRTLFVIILLYLIIRWLRNFFASPSPTNRANSGSKQTSEEKDGETTIRYNPKGEKIIDKDKGEYVDFEEVE